MACSNCQSTEISIIPAEIRLYRNRQRTLSHPPMIPAPDIMVCRDCGYSEFSVPRSWLAAGWLRADRESAPAPSSKPQLVMHTPVAASAT